MQRMRLCLCTCVSSWSSAHSTNGCSEEDFLSDACRGRIYCFAID